MYSGSVRAREAGRSLDDLDLAEEVVGEVAAMRELVIARATGKPFDEEAYATTIDKNRIK